MVRHLFPLACLAVAVSHASAQALPGTSQPATNNLALASPLTTADTVRALHNLFRSRRSTGNWLAGGSAGVIAITGIGTLADNNGRGHGYYSPNAAEAALLIGIGTAPAWIPGLITLTRFNAKQERAVLQAYEQTGALPHYVQRRLSARFFNTNYRFRKRN